MLQNVTVVDLTDSPASYPIGTRVHHWQTLREFEVVGIEYNYDSGVLWYDLKPEGRPRILSYSRVQMQMFMRVMADPLPRLPSDTTLEELAALLSQTTGWEWLIRSDYESVAKLSMDIGLHSAMAGSVFARNPENWWDVQSWTVYRDREGIWLGGHQQGVGREIMQTLRTHIVRNQVAAGWAAIVTEATEMAAARPQEEEA